MNGERSAWAQGGRIGSFSLGEKINSPGNRELWRATTKTGATALLQRVCSDLLVREAQVHELLDHENILAPRAGSDLTGPVPFLVFPDLGGLTLDHALVRDSPKLWPASRRRYVITRIASALAHAHERGVVHGDLTPESVLITSDGAVKLLGFGKGRIAPLGSTLEPTPRVDVLALGRLIEMLGDEKLVKISRRFTDPDPMKRPANAREALSELVAPRDRHVCYGIVEIAFSLVHDPKAKLDAQVCYSLDGGWTWKPATPAPESPSLLDLDATPEGAKATFVWDSIADLGFQRIDGVLVSARTREGAGVIIPAFTVDNTRIDPDDLTVEDDRL